VGLLLTKLTNFFAESADEKQHLKLVNICQSYKQGRGCAMHFVSLANTLLNVHETTMFLLVTAKYSLIRNYFFSLADSAINLD